MSNCANSAFLHFNSKVFVMTSTNIFSENGCFVWQGFGSPQHFGWTSKTWCHISSPRSFVSLMLAREMHQVAPFASDLAPLLPEQKKNESQFHWWCTLVFDNHSTNESFEYPFEMPEKYENLETLQKTWKLGTSRIWRQGDNPFLRCAQFP